MHKVAQAGRTGADQAAPVAAARSKTDQVPSQRRKNPRTRKTGGDKAFWGPRVPCPGCFGTAQHRPRPARFRGSRVLTLAVYHLVADPGKHDSAAPLRKTAPWLANACTYRPVRRALSVERQREHLHSRRTLRRRSQRPATVGEAGCQWAPSHLRTGVFF